MPEQRRILIVDDDREIVRGLALRLRSANFDVHSAGDGYAGLAAAAELHPDAILLDLSVPGLDGFGILDNLRHHAETKDVPVIVLSASVAEEARARALGLGARLFVPKPYSPAELLSAIEMTCPARA